MLKYISLLLLTACSHDISRLRVPGLVPDALQTEIKLPSQKGKSLQVLYLGCGHMIIQQNDEAFFTDPFFSIQPGKNMVGKVQSKKEYHERWHQHINTTIGFDHVQAGLVAHTHYDHVMDLPLMLDKQDFPNLKNVYGNAYLPRMLINFKDKGVALQALTDKDVFNPCTKKPADSEYGWMPLTTHSRFLAIQTHHAPHAFGKLFMSRPMKKKQEKYFRETLTKPDAAIRNFKWTVGSSYAYLVDWFDGADTVRLYIQTSASRPPNGLPPAAELKKKKVDLVILCYASTPNVKKYPEYLLDAMKGTDYPKILMVHWEDFFTPHSAYGPAQLVPGTNPRTVVRRWKQALNVSDNASLANHITMPRPGTVVRIAY
jgi:hypothetical protein